MGKRGLRLTLLIACVLVGGHVGVAAAAQVPATLTGETLTGTQQTATVNCDFTGTGTGTGTFSVSGAAAGPYPGTFTETGSFSTQNPVPYNGQIGTVTQFDATFTIDSPTGQVTGTKSLGSANVAEGLCNAPNNPGEGAGIVVLLQGAQYDARIQTATGTYDDNGTTTVSLQDRDDVSSYPPRLQDFFETFSSSLAQPIPERPGKGCGDKHHAHQGGGCS